MVFFYSLVGVVVTHTLHFSKLGPRTVVVYAFQCMKGFTSKQTSCRHIWTLGRGVLAAEVSFLVAAICLEMYQKQGS